MIQPNDITFRLEEVRRLIEVDNVPQAMSKVMDFATDLASEELIDEATILLSNYNRLKGEMRRKEIKRDKAIGERDKILHRALRLTRAIVEYADTEVQVC